MSEKIGKDSKRSEKDRPLQSRLVFKVVFFLIFNGFWKCFGGVLGGNFRTFFENVDFVKYSVSLRREQQFSCSERPKWWKKRCWKLCFFRFVFGSILDGFWTVLGVFWKGFSQLGDIFSNLHEHFWFFRVSERKIAKIHSLRWAGGAWGRFWHPFSGVLGLKKHEIWWYFEWQGGSTSRMARKI